MFLENSQNSQENTCTEHPRWLFLFLNNFIKKYFYQSLFGKTHMLVRNWKKKKHDVFCNLSKKVAQMTCKINSPGSRCFYRYRHYIIPYLRNYQCKDLAIPAAIWINGLKPSTTPQNNRNLNLLKRYFSLIKSIKKAVSLTISF